MYLLRGVDDGFEMSVETFCEKFLETYKNHFIPVTAVKQKKP